MFLTHLIQTEDWTAKSTQVLESNYCAVRSSLCEYPTTRNVPNAKAIDSATWVNYRLWNDHVQAWHPTNMMLLMSMYVKYAIYIYMCVCAYVFAGWQRFAVQTTSKRAAQFATFLCIPEFEPLDPESGLPLVASSACFIAAPVWFPIEGTQKLRSLGQIYPALSPLRRLRVFWVCGQREAVARKNPLLHLSIRGLQRRNLHKGLGSERLTEGLKLGCDHF